MFWKKRDLVAELVQAVLATNEMLRAENRDMHNRLMVRFPQEFGQYMQSELAVSSVQDLQVNAQSELKYDDARGYVPPTDDMVLGGSRAVVPPIVNQELAEERGR